MDSGPSGLCRTWVAWSRVDTLNFRASLKDSLGVRKPWGLDQNSSHTGETGLLGPCGEAGCGQAGSGRPPPPASPSCDVSATGGVPTQLCSVVSHAPAASCRSSRRPFFIPAASEDCRP